MGTTVKALWLLLAITPIVAIHAGQSGVPRTWDTQAMQEWATPLAATGQRPGHFTEAEYYSAPIDNYRTYPVYLPGREPAGYWDSLRKRKPLPLVELNRTAEPRDWVSAGRRAWNELDVPFFRLYDAESIAMARSPKYFNPTNEIALPDGTVAMYRWVVTPQGIALGITACSSCHTRYLGDGTAIAGAGLARRVLDPVLARMDAQLLKFSYIGDTPQMALFRQFGVPWLRDDIHESLKHMPEEDIARVFDAQIAGVTDRPNGSPYYITKIPDLIGIRERRYIDHTATHQHRGPADLMRYAALVEYADAMDFGGRSLLTAAQRRVRVRWPDETLYALSQYLYSLQPPVNPNPRNELSAQGRNVFNRGGCPACHTPPLYTSNRLTLAQGFTPPSDHALRNDILLLSVGTDPSLALKTRKGTGLYKIPSLKGVWYRGLYGHDGAVSSLEDWFDPNRLRDDYVPTGFIGVGIKRRAVPGHEFGLNLAPADRQALIAFLRTL